MGDDLRTERELSLDFLRVTEAAAIASAKTMGQGDRKFSDHVAVEAVLASARRLPNRARKLISPSTRSKAQIFARSVRTTRSPYSPQLSVAVCSTRLTFTWTR
jgi:hypothetical protein